jgi:hypothetical protein
MAIIFADNVTYFSRGDKNRFFLSLYENKAFVSVIGQNITLKIKIDSRKLSYDAFWDLVALFYRQGIDMAGLTPIITTKTKRWLENEAAGMLALIEGKIKDRRNLVWPAL